MSLTSCCDLTAIQSAYLLEIKDFEDAANDPNMKKLAEEGITLTNFWAITHPSEPNYVAAVVGDEFGMDNDDFWQLPANISTVADLLDTRGISWGEYRNTCPTPVFRASITRTKKQEQTTTSASIILS